MRDSVIGTDRGHRSTNTSWGAIFAGTVTFLALMLVFGMISAALGLQEVDGAAVGIWSVVAILLALTAGGFIAGALAVRGGLLHGLVTWATSLVAVVALVDWLGAGVLGAIGGALGNVAQTAVEQADVSATEVEETVEEADVNQEDVDEAQQQAGEAAEQVQDDAAEAAWWGVAGLVLGAVLAGLAGAAGARAAHTHQARVHTGTDDHRSM